MEGTAPRYAGCKRPHALTMAVYDLAAVKQRASAASLSLSSAFVPFFAPPVDVALINAVLLSAVAPRAKPAWICCHFGLRLDLTVTFIDEKVVTATDLNSQQNRFRLPNAGCPEAAKVAADRRGRLEDLQHGSTKKRKKKQGKKHGGLPIVVCNVQAGTKHLQLTRWERSHGKIIKGEGYLDFITRCYFKEKDVVEIWAFKERRFHLFGVDMCHASPLYVVLAKKERPQPASVGMGKCTQLLIRRMVLLDFGFQFNLLPKASAIF
ncbi:hypothetical protein ZWY2020_004269 [Hordeum vulgare]|nr:hypothetical protein ZWY2020_004269 [Hordeum vulgare]